MKASGVKLQSTKTGYRDRYFLPKFDERNVSTGSLIEVEVVTYCMDEANIDDRDGLTNNCM